MDKEHSAQLLEGFHIYYDEERYPIALYGNTPQEVFDGATIDKKRFSKQIIPLLYL